MNLDAMIATRDRLNVQIAQLQQNQHIERNQNTVNRDNAASKVCSVVFGLLAFAPAFACVIGVLTSPQGRCNLSVGGPNNDCSAAFYGFALLPATFLGIVGISLCNGLVAQ